jgi:hypothetical protein
MSAPIVLAFLSNRKSRSCCFRPRVGPSSPAKGARRANSYETVCAEFAHFDSQLAERGEAVRQATGEAAVVLSGSVLLSTQRDHRLDARRACSGNPGCEKRGGAEEQGGDGEHSRIPRGDAEELTSHQPAGGNGEGDAQPESDRDLREGAAKDHTDHAAAIGAKRHTNANLTGALFDGIGHNTVQTHGSENKAEYAEEHLGLMFEGVRTFLKTRIWPYAHLVIMGGGAGGCRSSCESSLPHQVGADLYRASSSRYRVCHHDFTYAQAIPFDLGGRFPRSAKGERPLGSRSQICSKWHVIGASVRDVIGVFSRLLGTIKLADGFGTNEPGPHILRLWILFGAAFSALTSARGCEAHPLLRCERLW